MTPLNDVYKTLVESMNGAGVAFADRNAKWLIQAQTGLPETTIISRPDHEIPPSDYLALQNAVKRILKGEPISRVLGTQEFWGNLFFLSPATLDPRPETEMIVDLSLKRFPASNPPEMILDLGTGTGCLLISLLGEYENARGVAVDYAHDAIHMARLNARINGVEERFSPVCASWADSLQGKFDLIVSNPPYILSCDIESLPDSVKNYDPILSLDGGEDGLDSIKKIISSLKWLLNTSGKAFIEIGFGQVDNVVRLIEDIDTFAFDVHHDMAGIPRVVEIYNGDK